MAIVENTIVRQYIKRMRQRDFELNAGDLSRQSLQEAWIEKRMRGIAIRKELRKLISAKKESK